MKGTDHEDHAPRAPQPVADDVAPGQAAAPPVDAHAPPASGGVRDPAAAAVRQVTPVACRLADRAPWRDRDHARALPPRCPVRARRTGPLRLRTRISVHVRTP
ncbi:MAG: hypothetical protein EON52_11725 [Actinomycetales bacterium]|nr:MAG: hypothetical protein EON52_11725 [Actinomycetales bacterium]